MTVFFIRYVRHLCAFKQCIAFEETNVKNSAFVSHCTQIVQDLLYAHTQCYMYTNKYNIWTEKKRILQRAGTFVFFFASPFVLCTQKPQTKKFSCATFYAEATLLYFNSPIIIPSAKLLRRKTEIFVYCFPYMYAIYAILLAVSRRFLNERMNERTNERKKNTRCLQHIKTAVRDQTSAVFFFIALQALWHVICMYKQIQTNY